MILIFGLCFLRLESEQRENGHLVSRFPKNQDTVHVR